MAMATLPLFHQLLTLSNPKSATILRPRLPTSQRTFHLSILCCSSTSQSPEANLQSAESSINIGLELFSKGRVKEALVQFEAALNMDPNPMEAQAALYNKACCHAYRYA